MWEECFPLHAVHVAPPHYSLKCAFWHILREKLYVEFFLTKCDSLRILHYHYIKYNSLLTRSYSRYMTRMMTEIYT